MFSDSRIVDRVWTAHDLRACLEDVCGGEPVIVLANRQPFRHEPGPFGDPEIVRSASGLVTALEPVVESCHGVWVGHGSGTADRAAVGWRDGLEVPPANPAYRLRRVWLDAAEWRRYYLGFANEGLWPLCHRVPVRPIFRAKDFTAYSRVNGKFASAVCEEATSGSPVVLVQDYHFALAPAMIRSRLPRSTIVTFWHIPWPRRERFERCPRRSELFRGLLASDIIGFHTPLDCLQFADTAASVVDCDTDHGNGTIRYAGHETLIRAYPVSIEWPNRVVSRLPAVQTCRDVVRRALNVPPDTRLIVGVDRLDYTKGLCEKALAYERLLELDPEIGERVAYVQIAEPSRECLPAYRKLRTRLIEIVGRINRRFGRRLGRSRPPPFILREAHHEPEAVYTFLRAADVCHVGSLHDGMNLVAKEFAAARDDEDGVLVLSTYTGAARQMVGALLVDPYDLKDSARVLGRALKMAPHERRVRMRNMRAVVSRFNGYW